MDVFVARQPIFDRDLRIYGYELLYRDGVINKYIASNADVASSNVMLNSFFAIGIDNLTGGERAFINFTAAFLKQGTATLFPKDQLVVEILETVLPEKEIIEKCKELKSMGYTLALDDYVFSEDYLPLVELADIIKVDFLTSTNEEKKGIIEKYKRYKIKFLAEKIESYEEFHKAKEYGYELFQGFFFSKPVVMSVNDVEPVKYNYLRLIQEVSKPDLEFSDVAAVISNDVSLSYKLLRLVNSVAFAQRTKITSLKRALVILGQNEIKKWVSLISVKGIGDGQPQELIRLSLIRAKFFENMAASLLKEKEKEELFLMGLFSTLHIIMNRPMEEVLKDISISSDIKNALIKKEGLLGWAFNLMLAYENADWNQVAFLAEVLNIDKYSIIEAYIQAVAWCSKLEKQNF